MTYTVSSRTLNSSIPYLRSLWPTIMSKKNFGFVRLNTHTKTTLEHCHTIIVLVGYAAGKTK